MSTRVAWTAAAGVDSGHSHIAAFFVVGLVIVLCMVAVRARMFGRIRHGFFIALVLAVTGIGLVTASVQG